MTRTLRPAPPDASDRDAAGPISVVVTTFNPLASSDLEAISAVSPLLKVRQAVAAPVDEATLMTLDLVDAEVLFTTYVPQDRRRVPALRWVHLTSAGADAARRSEIWDDPAVMVTTSSGIHAAAMSQWAFALILYQAQRLDNVLAFRAHRRWPEPHQWPTDWPQFAGDILIGKTLGLVGYGSTGRECARLGRALGMSVIATRRHPNGAIGDRARYVPEILDSRLALDNDVHAVGLSDIDQVFSLSDYVVCTLPLTDDTHHLVNADKLALMKEGAFLINMGRGGVVDEEALVAALRSGRLAGAALDVFEQEPLSPESSLFEAPNLIMSPHIAGLFADYWEAACAAFCKNLALYLEGEPMLNVVNRAAGY